MDERGMDIWDVFHGHLFPPACNNVALITYGWTQVFLDITNSLFDGVSQFLEQLVLQEPILKPTHFDVLTVELLVVLFLAGSPIESSLDWSHLVVHLLYFLYLSVADHDAATFGQLSR